MDNGYLFDSSPVLGSFTPWETEDLYQSLFVEISSPQGDVLVCDNGNFSFSGSQAFFIVSRAISCESATYYFSGANAAIRAGINIVAQSASLLFSGNVALLTISTSLSCDAGSFVFSGGPAFVFVRYKITAFPENCMFTAATAEIYYHDVVDPIILPAVDTGVSISGMGILPGYRRRKKRRKNV